jgi:hypothetical protein
MTEILFIFLFFSKICRYRYHIISPNPHSKTTLEGTEIAPFISIAAVKDGKAAKGSLGEGAV